MKNSFTVCKFALALTLSVAGLPALADDVSLETGSYTPSWNSLNAWECPEWFENAKFGIWAHWGPQCQAEDGDWYARNMYIKGSGQYNYHVSHYGDPSVYGLKDLCNDWKAANWNPDSLIHLYKSVGAKYFMTLGQHHDNFDLWNSTYQEWNSVNVGPKKDIVKGWADACTKYGLPLGISMHGSHTWSWMEPSQDFDGNLTKEDGYKLNADGTEKWWKGMDPQELYAQNHTVSNGLDWGWGSTVAKPSTANKKKFQNRVLEAINNYNPKMLYFDDTVLPFYGCDESIGLNIVSDFYNHAAKQNNGNADVVVMGKILNESQKDAMLWDVERGIPDQIQAKHWQTCSCIGEWHYCRDYYTYNRYKTAQQVIDMLVDIVSKNGNLLLSIPIRADGTLDSKEYNVLKGIKAWMDINSSSIYGTRPWTTCGEGPLTESANPLAGQGFNENITYSNKDVRYAQRNDTLFATIMQWPTISTATATKTFTMANLGFCSKYFTKKVGKVSLLGYGEVAFKNSADGLVITLPTQKPNAIAPVFQITFSDEQMTSDDVTSIVTTYNQRLDSLRKYSGYNTGWYSPDSIEKFASKLKQYESVTPTSSDIEALNDAYSSLISNGRIAAGAPTSKYTRNLTITKLIQASAFSRLNTSVTTRFATPKNWTVENFTIPQSNSDGTKNGLDKYPGYDCLMLGVWDDRANSKSGNLANARIYRKIHLEAGQYYFGATYNTIYSLNKAYIFVSDTLVNTSDISSKAIAFNSISDASGASTYYGIFFTIDKDKDVYIGFQADLSEGSTCQEFRCKEVRLLLNPATTGITQTQAGSEYKSVAVYDTMGRRLPNVQKGVNIIVAASANGKKTTTKVIR